jgi:hypothetical protein
MPHCGYCPEPVRGWLVGSIQTTTASVRMEVMRDEDPRGSHRGNERGEGHTSPYVYNPQVAR